MLVIYIKSLKSQILSIFFLLLSFWNQYLKSFESCLKQIECKRREHILGCNNRHLRIWGLEAIWTFYLLDASKQREWKDQKKDSEFFIATNWRSAVSYFMQLAWFQLQAIKPSAKSLATARMKSSFKLILWLRRKKTLESVLGLGERASGWFSTRKERFKQIDSSSTHGGSDYEAKGSWRGGDGTAAVGKDRRDELPRKQLPMCQSQGVDVNVAAWQDQGTRLSVAGNTRFRDERDWDPFHLQTVCKVPETINLQPTCDGSASVGHSYTTRQIDMSWPSHQLPSSGRFDRHEAVLERNDIRIRDPGNSNGILLERSTQLRSMACRATRRLSHPTRCLHFWQKFPTTASSNKALLCVETQHCLRCSACRQSVMEFRLSTRQLDRYGSSIHQIQFQFELPRTTSTQRHTKLLLSSREYGNSTNLRTCSVRVPCHPENSPFRSSLYYRNFQTRYRRSVADLCRRFCARGFHRRMHRTKRRAIRAITITIRLAKWSHEARSFFFFFFFFFFIINPKP